MSYCMMKLFLTCEEHDEASKALARVARRIAFSARERAVKQREIFKAMLRKDELAAEIQDLERRIA